MATLKAGSTLATSPAVGDSSTKLATTAFVSAEIANDAVPRITSVDNQLARFDGTTGAIQNSSVVIDDRGNVGIGGTPSAWGSNAKTIEMQNGAFIGAWDASGIDIGKNAYYDTSWKYKANGLASIYDQNAGVHTWYTAKSGTADNPITWTTAMTLGSNGNLVLNSKTTSAQETSVKLEFNELSNAKPYHKNNITVGSTWWGDNSYMAFTTQNAERMRIGSTGNLLVGTTTDNGVDKLQVNGGVKAAEFNTEKLTIIHTADQWTTLKDMTGLEYGVYMIHQCSFDAVAYGGFIMFSINESAIRNALEILNTKGYNPNCGFRLNGRIVECIFPISMSVSYSIIKI